MFLGIDASLSRTGIAFYDPSGKEYITEYISAPKDLRGPARLHNILHGFKLLTQGVEIKAAAIEGYAFGVKGGRLADLAEWGGLIRLELYRRNIPTIVVPPQTMKKYLHDGKLEKNQVLLQVYKQYGVSCGTDDEADALVLSDMARQFYEGYGNVIQRKKEALQKSAILIPKRGISVKGKINRNR